MEAGSTDASDKCSTRELAKLALGEKRPFGLGVYMGSGMETHRDCTVRFGDRRERPLLCVARRPLFCDLPKAAIEKLGAMTSPSVYLAGSTLFVEGEPPRGVFILCSGQIKLSTDSADGRTLIIRVAESGDVLGLSATITGKPYELTGDVIEPAQANFISRANFLQFLHDHGEATLHVAEQLSETYHSAIDEMRMIGLSHSAEEKVARFLLDQSATVNRGKDQLRFTMTFTHEEISQVIGSARETVSRVFAGFKRKGLVQTKGSVVTVLSRAGLCKILHPYGS